MTIIHQPSFAIYLLQAALLQMQNTETVVLLHAVLKHFLCLLEVAAMLSVAVHLQTSTNKFFSFKCHIYSSITCNILYQKCQQKAQCTLYTSVHYIRINTVVVI